MRLFHFSDDPGILKFNPRPVRTPSPRAPGMEWLNGPLVWAIDEPRQPLYLFPRACPRILIWRKPDSRPDDIARFWTHGAPRMIAFVERDWLAHVQQQSICRYELPPETFQDLNDAGMHVSSVPVHPLRMDVIADLPGALAEMDVDLRIVDTLSALGDVWSTSLHASGIRLRNSSEPH